MKCLALFALASITVVSAAGAALLPEWQLNDRFIIDQQIGVDIAIPEVALSLDVQTSDMVWHVAERSMQTVETCPVSYEVYRLPADAAVTASGQAHVFYPVQIDLMIRLTQAEVTCEAWVRTQTLSIVRECISITGRVEVFLFGLWRDIGPIAVDLCVDSCPDMPDYVWPLAPGANWSYAMDVHGTGHVIADFYLFGVPLPLDEDINETQSYAMTVTALSGGECIDLYAADALSSFTVDYDYCEDIRWFSHRLLDNFASGEKFSIRNFNWGAEHEPSVTPTPIPPTPTETPPPPTDTPPPTSTSPPPTATSAPPTATPTPPTDTPAPPTATLAPPTDTPTPTATASPTPTSSPTAPVTPSATPLPTEPELDLRLNSALYVAGDRFVLELFITNPGPSVPTDVYVLLDVYQNYYFWPSWSQNVDRSAWTLPPWGSKQEMLLDFIWPSGAGAAAGIYFHAAMFQPGTFAFIGNYDSLSFAFE